MLRFVSHLQPAFLTLLFFFQPLFLPRQYNVTVGKDDISWKGIGYGPRPPAAPIVIIIVIVSVLSELLCANWGGGFISEH